MCEEIVHDCLWSLRPMLENRLAHVIALLLKRSDELASNAVGTTHIAAAEYHATVFNFTLTTMAPNCLNSDTIHTH